MTWSVYVDETAVCVCMTNYVHMSEHSHKVGDLEKLADRKLSWEEAVELYGGHALVESQSRLLTL